MNLGPFSRVPGTGDSVRYQAPVTPVASHRPAQLWFEVGGAEGLDVATSSDSALIALLIPAMVRGEDIIVHGPVSAMLLHQVRGPVQAMLRCLLPSLRPVRIHAEDVRPAVAAARRGGLVTGFSGGVDSFCVLADHLGPNVPPGMEISHLIYNNVGSHSDGGEGLFHERRARLEPAVKRLGLPFISINSNLNDFFAESRLTFQQTHTVRNAAAALLLQASIPAFLYASSFAFHDIAVVPSPAMARTDPVLLPMLSTEVMRLMPSGTEYSRVQKTLRVAEVEASYEFLDVCVWAEHAGNCSKCWKCMRTLLTLDIAGLIDRYASVFDLQVYRERRSRFIGEVLQSNHPLMREILAFARERGVALPWRSRVYAVLPLDRTRQAKKTVDAWRARRRGRAVGAGPTSKQPSAGVPANPR